MASFRLAMGASSPRRPGSKIGVGWKARKLGPRPAPGRQMRRHPGEGRDPRLVLGGERANLGPGLRRATNATSSGEGRDRRSVLGGKRANLGPGLRRGDKCDVIRRRPGSKVGVGRRACKLGPRPAPGDKCDVIPAKAGIQGRCWAESVQTWAPACAGATSATSSGEGRDPRSVSGGKRANLRRPAPGRRQVAAGRRQLAAG